VKRILGHTATTREAALADAAALVAAVQVTLGLAGDLAISRVPVLCEAGRALALSQLDGIQRLAILGCILQGNERNIHVMVNNSSACR